MCLKCIANKCGKKHCSEVFEDKLQFLWKSHLCIGKKYSQAPPKTITSQNQRLNTVIQQFSYLIQTKMAACHMVSISLLCCRLSPLLYVILNFDYHGMCVPSVFYHMEFYILITMACVSINVLLYGILHFDYNGMCISRSHLGNGQLVYQCFAIWNFTF